MNYSGSLGINSEHFPAYANQRMLMGNKMTSDIHTYIQDYEIITFLVTMPVDALYKHVKYLPGSPFHVNR